MQESTAVLTSTHDGIQAAIEAGRQLATHPFQVNGTPMLVIPENHKLVKLDDHRAHPLKIKQHTHHTTAESFVEYYNVFGGEFSVIFIDHEDSKFYAILDYHGDAPGDNDHTATFRLKKTVEWGNWLGNNKKQMTQEDFGRFIEDNLEEIITPAGAEMLEIALSIQAKTDTKFSSAQRLDNGQIQLAYHEEINGTAGAKGQLKIPQTFTIGLKLFEGGAPYQIEARLRYRIKDGALILWYELIRPHKTIEANIDDTTAFIDKETLHGKIFRGTPA